ncbi:MAG: hypothetical protein ACI4GD_03285 [Lachnospiraceae bacterium]
MNKRILFAVILCMMTMLVCACGKVEDDVNTESTTLAEIKEETVAETVEGEFVGWADNHTVEVKVEDSPMAFMVMDETVKSILENFEKGTIFTFEVERDNEMQMITKVLGE